MYEIYIIQKLLKLSYVEYSSRYLYVSPGDQFVHSEGAFVEDFQVDGVDAWWKQAKKDHQRKYNFHTKVSDAYNTEKTAVYEF